MTKIGKKAPWLSDTYVGITCPHCNTVFVELTQSSLSSSKASQCLKHLRVCPEYKGEVAAAPEKKKAKEPTNAELLEQLKTSEENAKQRHQEMLARIASAHGLPPPDPTSEDDLNRRLSEKRREACKRARKEERERKMDTAAMAEHLNMNAHMQDPQKKKYAKSLRACLPSDDPLAALLDSVIPTSGSKPDDSWNATGSRSV